MDSARTSARRGIAAAAALGMLLASSGARAHGDEPLRRQVTANVAAMEGLASSVRSLLATARAAKDRAKTGCVDEKLTRVDVSLRVAKDDAARAASASARGDDAGARTLARLVVLRRDMARAAADEARACFGAPPARQPRAKDETTVRVIVDRSLPADDQIEIAPAR